MKISKKGAMLLALGAALGIGSQANAEIAIAGELIVDLCNTNLVSGTNAWVNSATSTNSVGNFMRADAGNLTVNMSLGDNSYTSRCLRVQNSTANVLLSELHTPDVLEGNNTRSVEAWIYAEGTPSESTVVGWGNSGNQQMCSFRYHSGGNGMFSGWYADAGWNTDPLPLNQWVYVVYTYDGVTARGYINGNLDASGTFSADLATIDALLCIGAGRNGSNGPFDGYISDVRVHSGVLSVSDILNNYDEGMAVVTGGQPSQILEMNDITSFEGWKVTIAPTVLGTEPIYLQWLKDGVAIAGATEASLVLEQAAVSDSGVYALTAFNAYDDVEVTNSMTLTINPIPDYGVVTLSFDVNNGTGGGYTGTALAGGLGTLWNQINAGAGSSYTISGVRDSYGHVLDAVNMTLSGDLTSSYSRTGTDYGSPNPVALMQDYLFGGPYTVELSGLPAGEYDVYVYANNDSGSSSTITLSATNGGDSASCDTQLGEGNDDYRNIYSDRWAPYVVVTGSVASALDTLSFEIDNYLTGFQVQSVYPVVEIDGPEVPEGANAEVVPSIGGRGPFSYQWILNGYELVNETNKTLSLSEVQLSENGDVYELAVSNAFGSDTNSFTLSVVSVPTPRTINFDVNRQASYGHGYAGTAIATGGSVWNQFNARDESSPYTMSTVVDSAGNVIPNTQLTIDGTFNAWENATTGNPNPVNLMQDYMFSSTWTVEVTGLAEGEYNLYFYGHNDNANGATCTVSDENGGDSGSTTDYGDYRDIYQANALGNSYLVLTGMVANAGGSFTFTVENYFQGFQLQHVDPVVDGLEDQSVFVGDSVELEAIVSGQAPFYLQWFKDGDSLADETNATLTLSSAEAYDSGVYTLEVMNDTSMDVISNSMTLTVSEIPNYGPRTLQFDLDRGQKYSGTAIAPGTGTTWNYFDSNLNSLTGVKDSHGQVLEAVNLNITSEAGTYANSSTGAPYPHALMDEYVHGSATYEITALPAGDYDLYFYGHGDQADQGTSVNIEQANGGERGTIETTEQTGDYRNIYSTSNGPCYLVLSGMVAEDGGSFTFTSDSKTCGFQLQSATPVIEGLADLTVAAGTNLVIHSGVTGRAPMTYQWSYLGMVLPEQTNATLTLSNVEMLDAGSYSLVAGNEVGSTTNSFALTVFVPQPTEGPAISLSTPADGPFIITWPTHSGSAFNVLTNADLVNPNGWGDAGLVPYLDGDIYKVTNSVSGEETLFFKLESK